MASKPSSIGGGGINLSPMYVPIMPSTEGMETKAREAGKTIARGIKQGFNEESPEQMGSSFGDKFMAGFAAKFSNANFGLGISKSIDALGEQVDAKLASKLKGQLPGAYRELTAAQNELNDAHARGVETQQKYNDAMDQGFNKASIMIPLRRQLTEAHNEESEAQTRVTAAQGKYNDTLGRYNEASKSAFSLTSAFSGMLGGAMVLGIQGVISGMEDLIELGEHVFEDAIEGAERLGELLVGIGEDYHELGVQVAEYSDATGAALEDMKDRVQSIYGTLDVAGKNLGQTYAGLASQLDIKPTPQLDQLTKNLTELQGRYSNLKGEDLGSIFVAFKTPVDQLNSSLDTLVQQGQLSGHGVGELVNAMSGDASATLVQAGLSLGQVAHFVSELEKHGLPARSVMMGLGSAMKVFGDKGLDFKQGIAEAVKELTDPNISEANKDALSEKLFGGRRWAEVQTMIPALKELISSTADAYDAPQGATQRLLDSTETLGNKIDEFKHKAEAAFKPLGDSALGAVENGLDKVSNWFDTHHDQIIDTVQHWGDAFIDMIPDIKNFADAMLSMLGIIVPPMEGFVAMLLYGAAALEAMTFHWDDAKKTFDIANKFGLNDPLGGLIDKAKGTLDGAFDKITENSDKIKKDFDGALESARNMPDWVGGIPPASMLPPASPNAGPGPLPSAPEYTWSTPTHTPQGSSPAPPSVSPNTPAQQPLPSMLPTIPGTATPPSALPPFAQYSTPGAGYGASLPAPDKSSMAQGIYGAVVNAGYSPQTGLAVVAAANYESGLNPTIQEKGGSDHWGLFQEQGNYFGAHGSPDDQISWMLNELNSIGGPGVVDADPANVIANQIERGGYSGSNYDLQAAANLLGMPATATAQQVFSAQTGGSPSGNKLFGLDINPPSTWLGSLEHGASDLGHWTRQGYDWVNEKSRVAQKFAKGVTAPIWERPHWNPFAKAKEEEHEDFVSRLKEEALHDAGKQFLHTLFDMLITEGGAGIAEGAAGLQGGGSSSGNKLFGLDINPPSTWLGSLGHGASDLGHWTREGFDWVNEKSRDAQKYAKSVTAPIWERPHWNPFAKPKAEEHEDFAAKMKDQLEHSAVKQFLHTVFDMLIEEGGEGLAEGAAGFQGGGGLWDTVSKDTLGLIPDVPKDYDTFTNWGRHSGADQVDAVLDAAAVIPGVGLLGRFGKLGKALGHGLVKPFEWSDKLEQRIREAESVGPHPIRLGADAGEERDWDIAGDAMRWKPPKSGKDVGIPGHLARPDWSTDELLPPGKFAGPRLPKHLSGTISPEQMREFLYPFGAPPNASPYIDPTGHGYQSGGRGLKDTVPAWLTPKEYVWNEEAVKKFGWFIHWANEQAQGRGAGVASITRHLGAMAGKMFGGKGFGQGGGVGVTEVIWDNPQTGSQVGEANNQLVGPGTSQPGYYRADWKDHHGHVHTTFVSGPDGQPYNQVPAGTDIRPGAPGFPQWVYALGQSYGVTPSTYPGHQEWNGINHGIDWWPIGVSQDMSGQSYPPQALATLQGFAQSLAAAGSFGGQGAGPGGPDWAGGGGGGDVNFSGGAATAGYSTGGSAGGFSAMPVDFGSGGGAPGGPGMPGIPGFGAPGSVGPGKGGALFPGLPGQYGGYGAYGGENYDQMIERQRAIEGAQNSLRNLQREIQDKTLERDQLQKTLADEEAKPELMQQDTQLEQKKLQLQRLNEDLDTLQNQKLPEAQQDIDMAQRKAAEGALKAPKGGKDEAGAAEHEFGSQLLGGIAQSLGFPDIFGGKAPWDFGIVKMLGRFATGFMNGMQQQGGGGAGGGAGGLGGFPGLGGGAAGNIMGGLSGDMGVNIPKMYQGFQGGVPKISGAPNTVPMTQGMDPRSFGSAGPAPGPTTIINGPYQPGAITYHGSPTDQGGLQNFVQSTNYPIASTPGAFPAMQGV